MLNCVGCDSTLFKSDDVVVVVVVVVVVDFPAYIVASHCSPVCRVIKCPPHRPLVKSLR